MTPTETVTQCTYPEIPDNWRNMYSLEELIKQFNEHAEQAEKNRLEWIKSFIDNNPGQSLPDHLNEEFNLPKALVSICQEIDKLWISIGGR